MTRAFLSWRGATALVGAALAATLPRPTAAQGPVPTPSQQIGIQVGADRVLADWGQITGYFNLLASRSPAVRVDTLGRTSEGLPFIVATISTPANMARIEEIRRVQARLADPRGLSAEEERRLAASQPTVIFISCNIHANEIGASQMAMELAHRLATMDTLQGHLKNVVVLLAPSMNPDGQQMITEYYRKHVGTRLEGGPLPWLYHKYTGHDNNRDWYMVTQAETRLVTDLLYRRWFPAVFYDVHQQGSNAMRLTVPPMVDPIDPNVDPLIVASIKQVGTTMSWALEAAGKQGVGDGVTYDMWWHGGARSTPTRHNMIGFLTEAASARMATPITLRPDELRGHPRGLPRYQQQVNFPNPWPGGTWRLRDIMDYELIAAEALVKLASDQRAEYVRNFALLGRRQVELGRTQAPYAYRVPAAQHDMGAAAEMVEVLRRGGVEVEAERGGWLVRLDQPYRAHAKDLLEVQRFPRIEQYPGGPAERPYDVAGWTLPLQMGVRVEAVAQPLAAPANAAAARPAAAPSARCARAGVGYADTRCYRQAFAGRRPPRLAVYKPWTANMDEGWTRWVLEQQGVAYTTIADADVKRGDLRQRFDAVLIPDMSLREARRGMSDSVVPAEYAGGLGDAGIAQLKAFAEAGGTLILTDHATELADGAMGIPVKRIAPAGGNQDEGGGPERAAAGAPAQEPIFARGSILRVLVDRTHPIAAGMPDTAGVYFTNSVTLDVSGVSGARVIARYPARGEDILLSGFLQGGARLAGNVAAADLPLGRGRVVLFGFRPLYRAQSWGTFRMLFNSVLLSAR